MKEKHLNIKKIIAIVSVIVFAFLIILVSAIITHNATNSGTDKKSDVSKVENVTLKNDDINSQENVNSISNNVENEVQEVENTVSKENNNQREENVSNVDNTKNRVENNQLIGRLPVYNPDSVQLIKDIYGSDEKQIYLTFDDGPSPNITPKILQILKEEQVPATFFVLGSRAELYPELIKQEYNEGHYIANHGYTHTYSKIYTSVQSVVDEYNSTEAAIQNALGLSEFHSYLFRFPGGSSGGPYDSLKSEAKSYLNNNGIASTNWNCLSGDAEASGRTATQLLDRLYETAEGHNSLIVLMHDADDKKATADILREVIVHYKQEGYEFKNFYEIFQ